MTIKGLLFDKDGTLIDFNQTWLPCYREAAALISRHYGKPDLRESLLIDGGYIPDSNTWAADSVLAAGSNQQIQEHWEATVGGRFEGKLLTDLQSVFSAKTLTYKPVVEDTRSYLSLLRTQGYKIGVATMDDEAHARDTLKTLDVIDLIDFVCGADSGFGVKPEVGMISAFCNHCALAHSSTMMIGDSPRDLLMAKNAKAGAAVGVLTGASGLKALEHFADHILDSIADLPALLQSLTP